MATIGNPLGTSQRTLTTQEQLLHLPFHDRLATRVQDWLQMSHKQILISSDGSSGIIDAIPNVFLHRQALCSLLSPTYFGLTDSLKKAAATMIHTNMREEDRFTFTDQILDEFAQVNKANKPQLIWLCSPNNPTGTVLQQSAILKIARANPQALIVVDEAYQEWIDPDNKHSAIHLIADQENILVTKTLSKAFALPSAKIGIGIGSEAMMRALAPHVPRAVTEQQSSACLPALFDQEHIRASARFMDSERAFMMHALSFISEIHVGSDSRVGILIIRHREKNLHQILARHGVKTMDCNTIVGLEGKNYVRIGIQTHEKNVRFLALLHSIFQSKTIYSYSFD